MQNEAVKNVIDKVIRRKINYYHILRNSKYGEFIIQTNEVQYFLILLIRLKINFFNNKLEKYLEELTLGKLMKLFEVFISSQKELSLLKNFVLYNQLRNKLAHKMYTEKKLTEKECELAIKLGENILVELKYLLKLTSPKK